jgi:hypothetical protein
MDGGSKGYRSEESEKMNVKAERMAARDIKRRTK